MVDMLFRGPRRPGRSPGTFLPEVSGRGGNVHRGGNRVLVRGNAATHKRTVCLCLHPGNGRAADRVFTAHEQGGRRSNRIYSAAYPGECRHSVLWIEHSQYNAARSKLVPYRA